MVSISNFWALEQTGGTETGWTTNISSKWSNTILIEGSLEVKLPTIWTDEKQRWAEAERREEQKRADQRRESVRSKKIQVREKVGSRETLCFFQWFVAPEGRKRRLAKAVGAEPSGQMRDEKVYAVVARSTFPSQNVQSTPGSHHFWKLRCWKSARRRGAKHISKSKCRKHTLYGPLLDIQISFRVAGARDCAPSQTWAKRVGFVAFPKTMAGVGHLKRICKDAFSVAGAVHKTCSWEMLGGQGADFLREVAFWSIRSVGLLRWFCVTGAARRMYLASIFRGRRNTLDRWSGKNRKTHWYEAVSSALNFPFLKEVSQNCFVFDVVKCEEWRSLAELLRFWRC